MKRIIKWILAVITFLYLCLCTFFYFSQEKALFNTVMLPSNHVFEFSNSFDERHITMEDGKKLHGVLFKAENPKGIILWLPGGRGMIDSIGINAHYYTDLNYNLFILNFRGFGKSEGTISSEKQFNDDMQSVYNYLKKEYQENEIVIFGYSLGTGPAAALAAANSPKMLILKAPYYSMNEMSQEAFPYLPVSLLMKYKFPTFQNLEKVKCPVVLFHGDADNKIQIDKSHRLKEHLKSTDTLIVLKEQGHNNFVKNKQYLDELARVLE